MYKPMQPLGLDDYRRVLESSTPTLPIPPGKFNLSEPENSSSRLKFAGFPFHLAPSSE